MALKEVTQECGNPADRPGTSLYTYHGTTTAGNRKRSRFEQGILGDLLKASPTARDFLEIGSGRGEFAGAVTALGRNYRGIEPSDELRDQLVARGLAVSSEIVPPLPVPDASVDVVHSNQVVEHLGSHENVLSYFREAHRALRPGGLVSTVAPNCDTIGPIFALHEYQHSFITNRGRLCSLLRDAGFEVIMVRKYLTPWGFTRLAVLDRIFAHTILLFARSPLIWSIVQAVAGESLAFKIYKNLFDQVFVIGRKA